MPIGVYPRKRPPEGFKFAGREKQYHREWHEKNRKRWNERSRETHRQLKLEIIKAYGGCCACCGENKFEFLSVDHIYGGGIKHRKEVGLGAKFYYWLRRQGFPKDKFRILCYNCNLSLGHLGYCPHQREAKNATGTWG